VVHRHGPTARECEEDGCFARLCRSLRHSEATPLSAMRLPSDSRCPCCGVFGIRHVPLGHDEPKAISPAVIRLMRVPLEERLAKRPSR
jgi:hypothetical protein